MADPDETTSGWSGDQSTWPAHLRDDAPSQQCSRCQRCTWDVEQFGRECTMIQPNRRPCGGRFAGDWPALTEEALRDIKATWRDFLERTTLPAAREDVLASFKAIAFGVYRRHGQAGIAELQRLAADYRDLVSGAGTTPVDGPPGGNLF